MNFTFCKLFFAKNYKNSHFFKKNLILKRTKCPPKAFIFQKKEKLMISKEGIRNLYKAKPPRHGYTAEYIQGICKKCHKNFQTDFVDGNIIIGSLDNHNPFRHISYSRIKSMHDLGDEVAIVLSSCILFFDNISGKINIHVRTTRSEILINKLNIIFNRIVSLFRPNHSQHYNSIS